ncbi:hypothetical protein NC651_000007 [Populus alba x Populus x berolinensis]|nr:hypothetical protein NC651_000007 [Populus alba x Populus x berolinensis]
MLFSFSHGWRCLLDMGVVFAEACTGSTVSGRNGWIVGGAGGGFWGAAYGSFQWWYRHRCHGHGRYRLGPAPIVYSNCDVQLKCFTSVEEFNSKVLVKEFMFGRGKARCGVPRKKEIASGDLKRKEYENLRKQCRRKLKRNDRSFQRRKLLKAAALCVVTYEDGLAGDTESSDSYSSEEPEIAESFLANEMYWWKMIFICLLGGIPLSLRQNSKLKLQKDEDFATWQRIMRVDAVRENGDNG